MTVFLIDLLSGRVCIFDWSVVRPWLYFLIDLYSECNCLFWLICIQNATVFFCFIYIKAVTVFSDWSVHRPWLYFLIDHCQGEWRWKLSAFAQCWNSPEECLKVWRILEYWTFRLKRKNFSWSFIGWREFMSRVGIWTNWTSPVFDWLQCARLCFFIT